MSYVDIMIAFKPINRSKRSSQKSESICGSFL